MATEGASSGIGWTLLLAADGRSLTLADYRWTLLAGRGRSHGMNAMDAMDAVPWMPWHTVDAVDAVDAMDDEDLPSLAAADGPFLAVGPTLMAADP